MGGNKSGRQQGREVVERYSSTRAREKLVGSGTCRDLGLGKEIKWMVGEGEAGLSGGAAGLVGVGCQRER